MNGIHLLSLDFGGYIDGCSAVIGGVGEIRVGRIHLPPAESQGIMRYHEEQRFPLHAKHFLLRDHKDYPNVILATIDVCFITSVTLTVVQHRD